MTFGFERPVVLLLLLVVPALALLVRRRGRPALVFSRAGALARVDGARAGWLSRSPAWLRAASLAALVIALAGPRSGLSTVDIETEGIAIAVALDLSSSMLAEDFYPKNRLRVAAERLEAFIRERRYDRIGMVVFAGEALTQVPLTVDHAVLYRALEQMRVGLLEDGTAIGTALATAANRLRGVPGESRVIILVTDGENNRGEVDPITAARAAAAFGIRVYTIGVGSEGVARTPVARDLLGGFRYANLPVHIDEALLREIAAITNGRYFRATNELALDSIYEEIDRLEKSTVRVRRYVEYTPRHLPFIWLAAFLLVAEWAVRASRWGRVP